MNKVWDFLGLETQEDEDYEELENEGYDYDTEEQEEVNEERRFFGRKNKEKVVSMAQSHQIKMVISQPTRIC